MEMCGRCYEDVEEVFDPACGEKPEKVNGPIGQYYCPDCGAMVLAGVPHPKVCILCLEKRCPGFDFIPEK